MFNFNSNLDIWNPKCPFEVSNQSTPLPINVINQLPRSWKTDNPIPNPKSKWSPSLPAQDRRVIKGNWMKMLSCHEWECSHFHVFQTQDPFFPTTRAQVKIINEGMRGSDAKWVSEGPAIRHTPRKGADDWLEGTCVCFNILFPLNAGPTARSWIVLVSRIHFTLFFGTDFRQLQLITFTFAFGSFLEGAVPRLVPCQGEWWIQMTHLQQRKRTVRAQIPNSRKTFLGK